MGNTYNMKGKLKGRALERPKHRWEVTIKVDLI
jgi:hypothetical protein